MPCFDGSAGRVCFKACRGPAPRTAAAVFLALLDHPDQIAVLQNAGDQGWRRSNFTNGLQRFPVRVA